jgi:hypothetical protein
MYKIRINCSSKNDLIFNYRKIDNKVYDNILIILRPERFDYIYKIVISFEDYYTPENTIMFTNKYLDIICDRELTNEEYENFIITLNDIGFKCNTDINDDFNFNYILTNIKNPKYLDNDSYITRQKNLYIKGV